MPSCSEATCGGYFDYKHNMCSIHLRKKFNEENNDSGNTDTDAYLEQVACDEQVAEDEGKESNPRFRIKCISYRKRLADTDGISYKAAIDGLVKASILPDDSTKYVKEITFSQIKAKEEKTVLIVEEI